MNKKIASACIIVVMAIVIFGAFYVNRAASQSTLKVTLWVSCVLNPLPKVVDTDLDIVYVVIMAQPSGGKELLAERDSYIIQIWLRQGEDPWQLWSSYEQTSRDMSSIPVVWSTYAPTSEAQRNLDIYVKIVDSTLAVAEQWTTIYLPKSGNSTIS